MNGLQFICADDSATPVMGAFWYTYDDVFTFNAGFRLIGMLGLFGSVLNQAKFVTALTTL